MAHSQSKKNGLEAESDAWNQRAIRLPLDFIHLLRPGCQGPEGLVPTCSPVRAGAHEVTWTTSMILARTSRGSWAPTKPKHGRLAVPWVQVSVPLDGATQGRPLDAKGGSFGL
jgi:hypothetical protein